MPWRDACPVCTSTSVEAFLRRASVPVHQNMLLSDAHAARTLARGDLTMTVCRECGFVFNASFDPGLLNYGSCYENTQTHSPAFESYVDELVDHLVSQRRLRNSTIIEVGCGKGGFLKKLVEPEEFANHGIGFDPSYLGPDSLLDDRLQFRKQFYDAGSQDVAPDAVVCRHVIEHIESPLELLTAIRAALGSSPHAQVFFETPCVDWILQNHVVWDFFYEHCSLFTTNSLTTTFERAGFQIAGCRHVFGGQYLWLEAAPAAMRSESLSDAAQTVIRARRFAAAEAEQRAEWQAVLMSWVRRGPIALWGAGAKGVTFANLLDPDGSRIAGVVDVNPAKQGKFLAGTGHAIVSPDELPRLGVKSVLVLNPNYQAEIQRCLAGISPTIAVVDLMQQKRAA